MPEHSARPRPNPNPNPTPAAPVPDLGTFMAADTATGATRLGRVTAWDGDLVHLSPPGGGTQWTAAPDELRRPTEEEHARIRVLTSPVPASGP